MQLTINEKKKEPLLSRTLVSASIEFESSTPSYKDTSAALATNLKSQEDLVVIRHIYTEFGNKNAKVVAYVYDDEKQKQFVEPKAKVKKEKKSAENK